MLLRSSSLVCSQLRRYCAPSPVKRPWHSEWWRRYERWLEKYPRVYKYHRLMVDGTVHCYSDSKIFFRVSSEMRKGKPPRDFSRKDLEIYMLTSSDMVRVLVILVFMWTPPPIAETYFLLMLCFPRLLLTRHFWTPQQTEKFRTIFFRNQTRHRRRTVDALLAELTKRSNGKDSLELSKVLMASKSQQLAFSDLRKYANTLSSINIESLPFTYLFHLLSAHGMWPGVPSYSARLRRRAELIRAIDGKLAEEDLDHLSISDVEQSLVVRKLNSVGLSQTEKLQLLKDWIRLTRSHASDSFILHAAIIGYVKRDSL